MSRVVPVEGLDPMTRLSSVSFVTLGRVQTRVGTIAGIVESILCATYAETTISCTNGSGDGVKNAMKAVVCLV